jgi:hypothetical protein
MYDDWLANGIVVAATLAAVCLSVLQHYEGLLFTSRRLPSLGGLRRTKMLYCIGSVLILHVSEIWIFGLMLWLLLQWSACGSVGPAGQHVLDLVYLSAVTFTTMGASELAPTGPIPFRNRGAYRIRAHHLVGVVHLSRDGALLAQSLTLHDGRR